MTASTGVSTLVGSLQLHLPQNCALETRLSATGKQSHRKYGQGFI